MNKTININLAGIVFHIDEQAYFKLQSYLDSIKKYLNNTEGREEIIADIESRIAELFSAKITDAKQVIEIADVEEVIVIMGQPEDYSVDENIFDDQPKTKTSNSRKLYRDGDSKLIGGVCSGIAHYLDIDVVWVRLLFILLFFLGVSILLYIILWVVIPEAKTTAQKLEMQGEPANLSNIEKKVKEGFDNVKKKVENIDINEVEGKVKRGRKSFFDLIESIVSSCVKVCGNIIETVFKIFGKLVGVILLLVSFSVLISVFISLIGFSLVDINLGNELVPFFFDGSFIDTPLWLSSILMFAAIGIPFFFLFYLSLRLLATNISSMNTTIKLSLLGVWILSVISLVAIGVRQATSFSLKASHPQEMIYSIQAQDTLNLKMISSKHYNNIDTNVILNNLSLSYDPEGNKIIYSDYIRFNVKTSDTDQLKVEVSKSAKGRNYDDAIERAKRISYDYKWNENQSQLTLNDYFVAPLQSKVRDQRVNITIYAPEETVIKFDRTTANYVNYNIENDRDLYRKDMAGKLWKINEDNLLVCQDCSL